MVREIIEHLFSAPIFNNAALKEPMYLVDCTLGGGGHTEAFLNEIKARQLVGRLRVLALDQDTTAIEAAEREFNEALSLGLLTLKHARFSELSSILESLPQKPVIAGLMADLGFSSDQMEDATRGLSLYQDGPLDMRLDQRSPSPTAGEILGRLNEIELTQMFSEFGEERFSKTIARAIIRARAQKTLPKTTTELAGLIERSIPSKFRHHSRIHPATRVFQALRIYVNSELLELQTLLGDGILRIHQGGRAALLSFHSLEDRLVKNAFKTEAFMAITKKPIEPSDAEIQANPRARSAKLRVAEKC